MREATLLIAVLASALSAGAATFRTDTSLVLVNISVLDSHDRPVTDIPPTRFHVLDNGREQPIRFFAHEDAPVSLAVILDASGSMTSKWSRARSMLTSFCENLADGDELFLVTVGQRPRLQNDYTSDCSGIESGLLGMQPHGSTALLDAIPLAVRHLRRARNARHVVLIISDGGENASRACLGEIRRIVREANAQIYSATLGLDGDFSRKVWPAEADGPALLGDIAEFTGGRAVAIDDRRSIVDAAASIAREIHDQYVIGYQPPGAGEGGKYHRISVKVQRNPSEPRLSLFHRGGYRSTP